MTQAPAPLLAGDSSKPAKARLVAKMAVARPPFSSQQCFFSGGWWWLGFRSSGSLLAAARPHRILSRGRRRAAPDLAATRGRDESSKVTSDPGPVRPESRPGSRREARWGPGKYSRVGRLASALRRTAGMEAPAGCAARESSWRRARPRPLRVRPSSAGVPTGSREHREKSQPGFMSAGSGVASCAAFLLGGVVDVLSYLQIHGRRCYGKRLRRFFSSIVLPSVLITLP
jgi:hypothetical protein